MSITSKNELATFDVSAVERDDDIVFADQSNVVGHYGPLEFVDKWIQGCRV